MVTMSNTIEIYYYVFLNKKIKTRRFTMINHSIILKTACPSEKIGKQRSVLELCTITSNTYK